MNSRELGRIRKRRLILRQTAILGMLMAVLAVAGVASVAMLFGRMEPILSTPFTSPSPPQSDFGPMTCPRDEASVYPAAALVTVNVLNGSDMNGAARYLGLALERRGFAIGRIDDAPIEYPNVALIRTGEKGISRAYLLLAHAPEGATLAFDNRTTEAVDFIIGDQYDSLRAVENVDVRSGTVIPFPDGCTPLTDVIAWAATRAETEDGQLSPEAGDSGTPVNG
jgi:hypothetical protein